MRVSLIGLACLLSVLIAPPALALIVTLGPDVSSVDAWASDDAGPVSESFSYPTSLPVTGSVAESDGTTSSTSEFDLSDSWLAIAFHDSRDATGLARSGGSATIYFTVSDDVDYLISGTYSADDPDGRLTHLGASLFDETLGTYNYVAIYESRYTPNESFTLGQYYQDILYYEYGTIGGTLLAGHEYRFMADAGISQRPEGAEGPFSRADAAGLASLSFVPEPSTGLLIVFGLLGLAGWRRARA